MDGFHGNTLAQVQLHHLQMYVIICMKICVCSGVVVKKCSELLVFCGVFVVYCVVVVLV